MVITGGSKLPEGVSLPVTLRQLLTLTDDGRMDESTAGDVVAGATATPGTGNWIYLYTKDADAVVKFASLVSKDGAAIGLRVTTLTIQPDGRGGQFYGSYKATLSGFDRTPVYEVSGTVVGSRFRIDASE
jgi:hypothetical protein